MPNKPSKSSLSRLMSRSAPAALAVTMMLGVAVSSFQIGDFSFATQAVAAPKTQQKAPAVQKAPAKSQPAKTPAVQPTTKQTAAVSTPAKDATVKTDAAASIPESAYLRVSPIDLLKEPSGYLNKHVDFVGVFNRFSDTGLDYKKAFRDSRDYVSLYILRPDVDAHKIPLAELKLFFPRKKSEEVMNLESGDTIRIKGTVFSTALNEPWVDINEIKILQKTKEETKKPSEECC